MDQFKMLKKYRYYEWNQIKLNDLKIITNDFY